MGCMLDEEGKMKGSALIMDFESRETLDEYIANEPYVVEKVWEKIEVEPIRREYIRQAIQVIRILWETV